jgi:hypothetical protein
MTVEQILHEEIPESKKWLDIENKVYINEK